MFRRAFRVVGMLCAVMASLPGQAQERSDALPDHSGSFVIGEWESLNNTILTNIGGLSAGSEAIEVGGDLFVFWANTGTGNVSFGGPAAVIFDEGDSFTWRHFRVTVAQRRNPRLARYGDHVFLLGGGPDPRIERVTRQADGMLGEPVVVGQLPPPIISVGGTPRNAIGGVAAVDRWLFVLGGYDDGGRPVPQAYRAEMTASGNLGPWERVDNVPADFTQVTVVDQTIFGLAPGSGGGLIWATSVTSAGALQPWARVASSPYQRMFALGHALYRGTGIGDVGGWDYTDFPRLGAWQRVSEPDYGLCRELVLERVGQYLYAFGNRCRPQRAKIGGPVVSSIAPIYASKQGGAVISAVGRNFQQGMTASVAGRTVATRVESSTQLNFVAPPGEVGQPELIFTNPDGFSYQFPPTRTGFAYIVCEEHYAASPTTIGLPSSAGRASFSVSSRAPDCRWTASADAAWVQLSTSGLGTSSVELAFSANPGPLARSANVVAAGRVVTVVQSAATGNPTIPAAPSNLNVTINGFTVTLSWSPPQTGGAVSDYVLEAGSAPGLANVFVGSVGSQTTMTANVTPGRYFVRVRARNPFGTSDPSNETVVAVGTGCRAVPPAPTGVTGAVSNGIARAQWNAVSSATSYVLEVGSSAGASNLFVGDVGNTAVVTAAVGSGFVGFLRVSAVNECGRGPTSIEAVIQ